MTKDIIPKMKSGIEDKELQTILKKYVDTYRKAINPEKEEEEEEMCEICCGDITPDVKFVIHPCGHKNCCVDCVKDHVSGYINDGNVDIPCPVSGCGRNISSDDLFSTLIDSQELLDKYSRNSINQFITENKDSTFWCPYIECNKAMVISDANPRKECPYCKQTIALAATRCPHCTSELEA